jgi:signal transduction histidine kinase/CheY-like chemotaxis protein
LILKTFLSFNVIYRKIQFSFTGILIVYLILSSTQLIASNNTLRAIDGELDLRDWNFHTNDAIELKGKWGFYWNELITPDSIVFHKKTKAFRKLNQLWNDSLSNDFNGKGYATYHLIIKVNPKSPKLTFSIPDFYSAYSLYLNGQEIAKNGIVGKTKAASKPQWLPMIINLPETNGIIELVLHISNFRHSKGGASKLISLGKYELMTKNHNRDVAIDLFLSGCIIMTAFFFFGLYWFGKDDLQLMFFGLYSLMYSYRIFGLGIYTFHTLFPDIPWIVTLRLEYITLYLSTLFFACYTYELYKNETSIIFVRAGVIISFLLLFLTLFFPPSIFTLLIEPFFIVLLIAFMYIIITYIMAVLNKRTGSILSLIGTSIVLVVFGFNILVYFGIAVEHKLITSEGYFIFFFIQSVILFNIHTVRLNSAKSRAETISKSKTEFLSTISHEMRTPLNAVIGIANYIIDDDPKKEHISDLKSLKNSADNLNFLINDVLDYSMLEVGKVVFDYSDINLRELIDIQIRSLKPKANEKNINLEYTIDHAIPSMVIADAHRLNQVLSNLLGNAIKFTSKGYVRLVMNNISSKQGKIAIMFTVKDTGIGISKHDYETIFDNYVQASSSITRELGGTGLGLAITKKILALQNTRIHVYSIVGKGSKFYFTLEFEVSQKKEIYSEVSFDKIDFFEDKTVLLVEDNPVNVMIESKFLMKWKISVDVATNGKEALAQVNSKDYDLILMDLRMPIMDGYEASKKLRDIGVDTPIIALTASGISNVGDKIYESGMNDYIKKPFDPKEMYAKLRKYLA